MKWQSLNIIFFCLVQSRLLVHKNGNSELTTLTAQANLTIPNTTVVKNPLGVDFNLLSAIQDLQNTVAAQQIQINSLLQQLRNDTVVLSNCPWEGVACYCSYSHTPPFNDVVILTGTNCSQGQFIWTHVLFSMVATSIPGCGAVNTTGRCTFVTT
jgi:hypothetical protein